jgi:hypothetical protein
MPAETDVSSYKPGDVKLLRDIVSSAEVRLQAQLTTSVAADQRALVLAGLLVPTIAVLVGAATAMLLANPPQKFVGTVAFFASVGLFVSLVLTILAARPAMWNYPGTKPASWLSDISANKDEEDSLAALAADLQRKITDNAAMARNKALLVLSALWVAAATFAVGGVALALRLFCAVGAGG